MKKKELLNQIQSFGIIPVIKIDDIDTTIPLLTALTKGGLPIAEITFRTPCARDAIAIARKSFPNLIIIAGTIVTNEQARAAMEAGADALVSPGISENVVTYCKENDYFIIPGISNASDAQLAVQLGLDIVKFFPAETSGGIHTIKALSAPFPTLKFMPTGGINKNNLNTYLSYSNVIACGGTWMVKDSLICAHDFDKITLLTHEAIMKLLSIRLVDISLKENRLVLSTLQIHRLKHYFPKLIKSEMNSQCTMNLHGIVAIFEEETQL